MSEWLSVCLAVSLLLSLVTAAAAYMLYSGLLAHISVLTGSPPIKKITFAYKFRQGPYRNCAQLFQESHSLGPKLPSIGVYYDDPNEVPGPMCRYVVGSILSEGEKDADEELLKRYEASGFQVFSFPEVTHVVTCWFPHRTYFSVLLGVRRVYPRLARYIKERRLCAHPFLEIYQEGRIHFMSPLARQGDFYVPEVRRIERRLSEEDGLHSDSDVSGVDSNSEFSSGSGVLLSDSRETSPADSWVDSPPEQGGGDRGCRRRSSGEVSFKELDWEQAGGPQQDGAGTEVEPRPPPSQKRPEAAPQEWWGASGEE